MFSGRFVGYFLEHQCSGSASMQVSQGFWGKRGSAISRRTMPQMKSRTKEEQAQAKDQE